MSIKTLGILFWIGLPQTVWANVASAHADPLNTIILWATLILLFGLIGRYFAKALGQPGVLGELLMGILVGNICYGCGLQLIVLLRDSATVFAVMQQVLQGTSLPDAVHQFIPDGQYAQAMIQTLTDPNSEQWITITIALDTFARYGVIFLLFMVGLESSFEDLKKTGKESLQVAVIGVIAPIILGFLVMNLILPDASFSTALFVAATISATSVGITARVLQDMKKLNTREAKTILGAAMIDDVLGLLILAVVNGIVLQGGMHFITLGSLLLKALIFFPLSLWLGPILLRRMISWTSVFEPWEAKLLVSFIFIMGFAWLATLVNMASIIGAFLAGIIIHDGFFESREQALKNPQSIKNLLAPFEVIFAPFFFMLVGIQVRLESFLNSTVILFSIGLIAAAVLGKLMSGLGGNKRDDRMLIGVGMIPRGEVGLVFASVGKGLGIIPEELFSAIILMTAVTTFMTPMWMKFQYKRFKKAA